MAEMMIADETKVEVSEAQKRLIHENELDILDYLKSLNTDTPIKVTVVRVAPKMWKGKNVSGTLESHEEPISEEDIRDMYGGGAYQLRIQKPNPKGGWQYFAGRKIKIAGDPRIVDDDEKGPRDDSPAVQTAMKTMSELVRDRNQPHRMDPAIQSFMEGQQDSMRELRSIAAAKDQQMLEMLANKPNGNAASEALLEKMIDGESVRMMASRDQHESELRTTRERHGSEIDRIQNRLDETLRRSEDAHIRELGNVNRSFEGQIQSLTLAHQSTVDGYKREISHLDRELSKTQTELAEYRAKRDKPMTEQLVEIKALQEAFTSLSPEAEEKESTSTFERIMGTVMGSPLAEGIAARIADGVAPPAAQPTAPPEPELPIGRPVQLPDGRIVVRKADGTIVQLKAKGTGGPPATTKTPMPDLDPSEVEIAVRFMEAAINNDTDPGQFAATARNMVPGDILKALQVHGVDVFLSDVAKLENGSPLATQHGKNWAREVAQALLGE